MQIPYLRTTHRIDFLWLFLALWMDILALLTACAVLARTLSSCLDTMTGGMARMLILGELWLHFHSTAVDYNFPIIAGRNSSPDEMWPDVLGVTVIFLVSGMFMLGLENTKIFTAIMFTGLLGIVCQVAIVSWLKGTLDNFHSQSGVISKEQIGMAVSCALMCFTYPMQNPKRLFGRILKTKCFNGLLISTGIALFTVVITAGCLTGLIKTHPEDVFVAAPIFRIMEDHNLSKIIPAVACMLVLACSGALMELYPEMYEKLVELTTSDWQILAKQIGYENRDTGSPVLAIFTGGSLCAMLAFACPLENLIYILAGSHLVGIVFRSLYLLYIPFRPKILINNQESSSLNYSRLDSEANGATVDQAPSLSTSATMSSIRRIWNLTKIETNPVKCSKKKRKVPKNPAELEEMEREWLLLDEPQSPRLDRAMNGEGVSEAKPNQNPLKTGSEILDTKLEGGIIGNTVEGTDGNESSSSTDATDIDAIVDEHRAKIRVTTADDMEGSVLRMPSVTSWRLTLFTIGILTCGISILDLGIYQLTVPYLITGSLVLIITTVILLFIPKHANQKQNEYQNVSISVVALSGSLILMVATLSQSWPALLFWLASGLALIIRCDTWCCPCLDKPEEVIINSEPVFGSTHQLYLTEAHHIPKCHVIATRIPIRGR